MTLGASVSAPVKMGTITRSASFIGGGEGGVGWGAFNTRITHFKLLALSLAHNKYAINVHLISPPLPRLVK